MMMMMCDFAVNIRAICVSYINNITEAVCDGLSPDVASHVYSSPPWVGLLTKSTFILVPCKHICKLSCLHLQRHIVLTQNEFFWLQKPTKVYYYYYKCHGLECCQSHSCGGTGLAAVYTTRHDQPHFLLLNTLGHKDRHSGSKQYKIALSSLIFFCILNAEDSRRHAGCRFSGNDTRGGKAAPLTVTVQLCNCSQHGECVWDKLQEEFNSSDTFQIVVCDCDPLYEG